jgi:hypothetical protein
MIFACSVSDILTVPPEVYPAGTVTVPAFVEIVPLVEPLFAIPPDMDPDDPNALVPVRMSLDVAVAPDVSKNFAVPEPTFGMSTSGTSEY